MNDHSIETVQGLYAAFGRGDLPWIFERLAEDASWGVESVAAADVPFYGVLNGKQNISRFFTGLAEHVEFRVFEPHDFVSAGDQVFNHLRYEGLVKRTGKAIKMFSLQHWTLRSGKVVRWRGYEDTAAQRDAFRK